MKCQRVLQLFRCCARSLSISRSKRQRSIVCIYNSITCKRVQSCRSTGDEGAVPVVCLISQAVNQPFQRSRRALTMLPVCSYYDAKKMVRGSGGRRDDRDGDESSRREEHPSRQAQAAHGPSHRIRSYGDASSRLCSQPSAILNLMRSETSNIGL
jgi:hypothetical protein